MRTTEEFIKAARGVHKGKYDYSMTVYAGAHKKVAIICHLHGGFEQKANNHLRGQGCPICANSARRSSIKEFIERVEVLHGGAYDYSAVVYTTNDTPVLIGCHKHGCFKQTPANHLQGKGCPKCRYDKIAEKRKLDRASVIRRFMSVHGGRFEYERIKYKNNHTPVEIVCKDHGSFLQRPEDHFRGSICPKCADIVRIAKLRFSRDDFIENAAAIHGRKFDYSLIEYVRNDVKVEILCKEHGVFSQTPAAHLRGQGCPACAQEVRNKKQFCNLDDFLLKLDDEKRKKLDFSRSVYINSNEEINVECIRHGNFSVRPSYLLANKHPCPRCAMENQKSNIINKFGRIFLARARRKHGEFFDYGISCYKGMRSKLPIKCPIHGVFLQTAEKHLAGNGCPRCVHKSNPEDSLANFVESMGVRVERRVKIGKTRFEIDVWLSDYKIGVEYHGLFWHSSGSPSPRPRAHADKLKLTTDLEIRLIQIFADEWDSSPVACKNILRNLVGKSERIYAVDTTIHEVTHGEANEFFDLWHLQGRSRSSSIFCGLRDKKNRLVMVMAFSQIGSNLGDNAEAGCYKLTRIVSNENIVGGAEKIFEYFKSCYTPKSVVGYSDNRWCTGEVYKQLGFVLDGEIAPDYKYYKNSAGLRRFSKSGFHRKKLAKKLKNFNPSLTVRENCHKNGWFQVWDAGKLRWKFFDNRIGAR